MKRTKVSPWVKTSSGNPNTYLWHGEEFIQLKNDSLPTRGITPLSESVRERGEKDYSAEEHWGERKHNELLLRQELEPGTIKRSGNGRIWCQRIKELSECFRILRRAATVDNIYTRTLYARERMHICLAHTVNSPLLYVSHVPHPCLCKLNQMIFE